MEDVITEIYLSKLLKLLCAKTFPRNKIIVDHTASQFVLRQHSSSSRASGPIMQGQNTAHENWL